MLRSAFISLVALAAIPAAAKDPAVGAPTARVHVSDLDLASPAGVAEFDRRLQSAVGQLCPARSFSDEAHGKVLRARCVRDATRSAKAQRDIALARTGVGQEQIAVTR